MFFVLSVVDAFTIRAWLIILIKKKRHVMTRNPNLKILFISIAQDKAQNVAFVVNCFPNMLMQISSLNQL